MFQLYAEIDRRCLSFRFATGLRCLEGCGDCCLSEKVEARPLEMLPAVVELSQRGELEQWYTLLSSEAVDSKRCPFYSSELISGGHCLMYDWRPIMCRLFGFAVFTRKDGQVEFRACKPLQGVNADLVDEARKKIAEGLSVPRLSQYAMRVIGRDGGRGDGLLPIRQALRRAIEKYGLQSELIRKEREGLFDPTTGKGPARKLAA